MAKSNGKIALVAGACSGIGEATAERLAKAAYKVCGTSRREAQAGEWPFEILPLEVINDDALGEVVQRDGRVGLLVNKVGFAHDHARRSRHSYSPAAST
jgi:NADP-dependent 3-hydroxy acid dehydrogenase YdfG